MNYLKKLKIKNFKSWRDAEFNFVKGVNIIVGNPQSGKTNTFRALELLRTNRPSGGKFLSNFLDEKGKIEIEAEFADGRVILQKEIRTNKKNEKVVDNTAYFLETNNIVKDWPKVAKEVPDQVKSFLNMTDLNIHPQLAKPFLITSSPGEIARTVNKVTKLENTDEWNSVFTSQINKSNNLIESLADDLKEKENEIKKYSDIDRTENILERLTKVDKDNSNLESRRDRLSLLVNEIQRLKDDIKELDYYEPAFKYLEQINELRDKQEYLIEKKYLIEDLIEIKEEIREDNNCLDDIVELERLYILQLRRYKLKKYIEDINDLQLGIREDNECLKDMIELERIYLLKLKREKLNDLVCDLLRLNEEIYSSIKESEILTEDYQGILIELKVCPTCFTKVDKKVIERISDNL